MSAPTTFEFFIAILIIFKVSSHSKPPGSGVPVAGIILLSSPSTSNVKYIVLFFINFLKEFKFHFFLSFAQKIFILLEFFFRYDTSLLEIFLIPKDIIDVLGEPYIRSKNKIISSKSGLGLGTFIGKTLLERMKAKVKFGRNLKTNGAMVTVSWQTNNLLSI